MALKVNECPVCNLNNEYVRRYMIYVVDKKRVVFNLYFCVDCWEEASGSKTLPRTSYSFATWLEFAGPEYSTHLFTDVDKNIMNRYAKKTVNKAFYNKAILKWGK